MHYDTWALMDFGNSVNAVARAISFRPGLTFPILDSRKVNPRSAGATHVGSEASAS